MELRGQREGRRTCVLWPCLACLSLAHKDPRQVARQVQAAFWLLSRVKRAELFLSKVTAFWEWPTGRWLSPQLGVVGGSRGNQNMGRGLSCRTPIWSPLLRGPLPTESLLWALRLECVINGFPANKPRDEEICVEVYCRGVLQPHLCRRQGRRWAGEEVNWVIYCSYKGGVSHPGQWRLWMARECGPTWRPGCSPLHTPYQTRDVGRIPFMIFTSTMKQSWSP